MADTLYDRTLALAGLCQAVKLVQTIAKKGRCDEEAFKTSLASIINTTPANTLEVFGNTVDLKLGLECLAKGIDSTGNGEITRYLIGLIALESKLHSNSKAMSQLGDSINMLKRQTEHFDLFEEQMLNNIASVYVDVISPLGPRIQVAGNPMILQQVSNQHKIRALLLAGIRSAVLWRQVGGKRRHLIFSRKKMSEEAQALLKHLY